MKQYIIRVNGKAYDVEVEEIRSDSASLPSENMPVPAPKKSDPKPAEAAQTAPSPEPAASVESDNQMASPMAGTIVEILVNPGDAVSQGDVLLVLEAMKMENDVMATTDGTIRSIEVEVGKIVNAGDLLITLE